MSPSAPYQLQLFGGPTLTNADGAPLSGPAVHRHRLALLAVLARGSSTGVSRAVVLARLWPESDSGHARSLLNASVYALRRALGEGALVSDGDKLRLSHDVIDVDVMRFDVALARGDHTAVVAVYRGAFLDGFFLRGSPDFGHWVDRERAHLADAYAGALEALADDAEARNDWSAACRWWKARVEHDPYDSRVVVRLMHALTADGNPAGALHHARVHSELVRQEFGAEPAVQLLELVQRLRFGPGAGT